MRRLLAILFLVMLVISVPMGVSDLWVIALREAEQEWGVNLGAKLGVKIQLVPEYIDSRRRTIGSCYIATGDVIEVAWANKSNGIIYLNSHCSWLSRSAPRAWNTTVATLAHEMGHLMGLNHSADPASVMYWYHNGDDGDITALDRYNAATMGYGSALTPKLEAKK